MNTVKFTTSEVVKVKPVEEKYNATFVGDFCVRNKRDGSYHTSTAAVFWQETPPVAGYSNYFAIIEQGGALYITDGSTAVDKPIGAVVAQNGDIVYSRHRHDYRTSPDGSVTIDGGRDYMRLIGDYSICAPKVELHVVGPTIEVHPVE